MASKSVGLLNIVFGADLRGFTRAMKKAQRSIKKFGSSMKRTGANMTRNITMPVIALGAVALKTFANFEQAMLKVKAVSGATGQEFKSLVANAKRLGSETMFTASQVAELQLELSKLGLTPAEINKSTDSILSLAQATGHDLAQSAEIVASTMNSFGMEAGEATTVADMFAVASSSAAIDMEKLGVAMPTVGATADAVGVPLKGLTAMMMTLADSGMEASTMGTHLRKIFVELATKGISFDDAMSQINNSTDKVTTATNLFGKRAFAAGIILANNTSKTDEYTSALENSAGKSEQMAKIMDSGAAGAMRRLASQAEGVAIQLGEALIPLFDKLLKGVKSLLGWWSGLDSSMQNSIIAFGLLAAALGPMVSLMGTLVVAFGALVSPIGLAVLAIVGLVVGFAYVRENWDAFKERLGDWDWWKNALIQALQWVIEFSPISLLIKGFNKLNKLLGREPIENPFESMADGLEDLKVETKEYENEFGSFKDAMVNQGKEIMDMFGDFDLGKTIGVAAVGTGEDEEEQPIIGMTEQAFETYEEYLASLIEPTEETLTVLQQFWVDLFDNIALGLEKMGKQLGASLAQGGESFEDFAKKAKNAIRGVIKGLISEGVAAAVATALKNPTLAIAPWMIPVIAGAAAGLANTAFSALVPAFAQGGLVSGPTLGLIGEGSGTSAFNHEVVSPLDKLMGMMGATQVDVHGRIEGNNIVLVSDKAEISRQRFI